MSNSAKKLLLVEKSKYALENISNDNKYVFRGIFAVLNEMNRNKRIYTEDQYIPQINRLMPKILKKNVLGEINHPTDRFEVDLTKASHIVESIEYNKEEGIIYGTIRLLSTPSGELVKALVDEGVPIHISSRAAGSVNEDGTVVMKQLFTYDIVNDPGFEQAELKRVNEKYGFEDNDEYLSVYEVLDEYTDYCMECGASMDGNVCLKCGWEKPETPEMVKKSGAKLIIDGCKTKNKKPVNELEKDEKIFNIYRKNETQVMEDVITKSQFDNHSDNVKNQLKVLHEKLRKLEGVDDSVSIYEYQDLAEKFEKMVNYVNYLSETLDKSIKHNDHIVENVLQMQGYIDYLTENVDNNISYTKYLAETVDKSISHSDHIVNEVNKLTNYTNYLSESINDTYDEISKSRKYTEYVATEADKGLQYSEYLAGKIDESIGYGETVAKKLNESINYTEHVAKKLNTTIAFTNHLSENINNAINYSEYISETFNSLYEDNSTNNVLPESKSTKKSYENSIDEKLEMLLEGVRTPVTQKQTNKTYFLNHLGSDNVNKFNRLDQSTKSQVIEIFENAKFYTKEEANRIFENAVKDDNVSFELIKYMKPHQRTAWNALTADKKREIVRLSENYVLDSPIKIYEFFERVNMYGRENLKSLNENEIIAIQTRTEDNYIKNFELQMLNRRF